MKIIVKTILVLCFCFLTCSKALPQEPALEETANSIKGKLMTTENSFHNRPYRGEKEQSKEVVVNKCDIVYTSGGTTYSPTWDKGSKRYVEATKEVYKLTLSMAEVDPLSITLSYNFVPSAPGSWYWITFSFTDSDKAAKLTTTKMPRVILHPVWNNGIEKLIETKPTTEDSKKLSSFQFGFYDKEEATRFMNAFKHGVKLCGGKVDPF